LPPGSPANPRLVSLATAPLELFDSLDPSPTRRRGDPMKHLLLDHFYCWSAFSEARQIDFNGHLWVREGGNVVIDPVAISEADLVQLEELGGASLIVVTNRDHARITEHFRDETGAHVVAHEADAGSFSFPVDRTVAEGDEVVPGMEVVHLRYGKSPGEIALVWPDLGAAFISDVVWGGPSGSFSFLPDEKLADPPRAALELRKLLAFPQVATILVGDGHSIFGNAREKLLECLVARDDIWLTS
jgi:glyoxylase-like metal-dependent hydrolase (beta-lactamase superfamily II)